MPDRRRSHKTAQQAYEDRMLIVRLQASLLDQAMREHATRQSQDPTNWGFSGDLAQVESHLYHALRLLGAKVD